MDIESLTSEVHRRLGASVNVNPNPPKEGVGLAS